MIDVLALGLSGFLGLTAPGNDAPDFGITTIVEVCKDIGLVDLYAKVPLPQRHKLIFSLLTPLRIRSYRDSSLYFTGLSLLIEVVIIHVLCLTVALVNDHVRLGKGHINDIPQGNNLLSNEVVPEALG